MYNGTVINQLTNLSVDVNGLIIPGRSIESVLARHSFNLIVVNDDELFKISLLGSATAVRHNGREILLATQHQIKGLDESRVAMLTDLGSRVITSGGCRRYNLRPDTDAYDIVAFDFTEPCKDYLELKKRYFDLRAAAPDVLNVQVLAILLAGYPSAEQVYEIHENNHLGIARRLVVCLPDSQPSDEAMLTVKAQRPMTENPDGMSGGSAFVIQWENGKPRAYFAGIIVRGGKDSFRILKAGYVIAFLNSAFAATDVCSASNLLILPNK